jgi:radical SAM superfamily enzyme YgiQ (UPF0313 family)
MQAAPSVLFTHSYLLRLDPKQYKNGLPYPPLGTLHAAAVAREKGYDVSLFDTMFAEGTGELAPSLAASPDFLVIYDDGFNYLPKMCLTNMREAAFRMCETGKEAGCTVIVCSSDSSDRYAEYLATGADFVIIGEGEQTLAELLDALSEGNDAHHVAGIACLDNGVAIKTASRPVLKDLDALPLPAWDMLDINPYKAAWLKNAGYFSINMGTTRGCPFKCNWCAKPIYGNRYNSRSPEHVISEIRLLKERFDMDHIWFCDDIFGLKPGWVKRFAELVKLEKLDFRFKIQSRADLLLEEDTIADLASAGCETVWIGAESGSQKILDAMDKGITVGQVAQACGLMKEHDIKPAFFIQFGYPDETKEDIRLTISMINELLPNDIGISVSYPLPGTVFFERVKKKMSQKTNWTDSDEMAMMFTHSFRPAYYKQLHRYVHYNYRARLAGNSIRKIVANPFNGSRKLLRKVLYFVFYTPAAFFAQIRLKRMEGAS